MKRPLEQGPSRSDSHRGDWKQRGFGSPAAALPAHTGAVASEEGESRGCSSAARSGFAPSASAGFSCARPSGASPSGAGSSGVDFSGADSDSAVSGGALFPSGAGGRGQELSGSALTRRSGGRPRTPTAARHKALLSEELFSRASFGQPLPSGLPLIPREDCDQVIAELEQALQPCGDAGGLVFARLLIDSYRPPREFAGGMPDSFVRALAKAFRALPPDLAEQVVDEVTRTRKFLPHRADVEEVAARLLKRRTAALWLARKHRAAQDKRIGEQQREEACEKRKIRMERLRKRFGELPVMELIRLDRQEREQGEQKAGSPPFRQTDSSRTNSRTTTGGAGKTD
ncbi:hypothetical protein [Kiloniella sp. b19]|uniref:hypothetical protein n=1 Tax=Kiloniella sp. GXU_MW_B19 TaxID=3141326 RepID=UPI0031E13735